MEFNKEDDGSNAKNIKYILSVLDDFCVLSDLGVNKVKTMLGGQEDKSIVAERVGIKECT